MNDKFFSLPEDKQNRIIQAGYRIFANNSYKKCPVGKIAEEAGISKALLFHYFRNKKELYLYLLKNGGDITINALRESGCLEERDRFKAMIMAMQTKIALMKKYPELSRFMIRSYFEKDEEVCSEIKAYMEQNEHIRSERFIASEEGTAKSHLLMMYKTMQLAVEGYLFEKLFCNDLDPDKMEKEFGSIVNYWSQLFKEKKDSESEGEQDE
ncbi:MAG: TetR/AcrR family transcriptional regulator [Eubacteriales bacterium]|nr:TetR/AcrR family transcriptional regulator [Eubacteriales bacterium]